MSSLCILVVDASNDRWTLASRWLEPHRTARVHCGADALAALSLLQFDMVILDSALPDIDGANVLRKIKLTQPWAHTIALTERNRAPFANTDTHDVLSRPVDEIQLRQAVALACAPREPELN
ncbi:MAG: response regulator [Opitutaceae bacterium]|nr:response regulator [Opitutaceae bacterium]